MCNQSQPFHEQPESVASPHNLPETRNVTLFAEKMAPLNPKQTVDLPFEFEDMNAVTFFGSATHSNSI
ncbi:hypothetical protein CAEBREN_04371 [Caenorhabditis brenneri]|uniref:Uncharacterized protein n=1 Tax=Caenorhabditis brenneri TaxID=135651 RepID=G0NQS6_CAEBE|nr:hypothetical protein CAEBREN_04371 [Caenorhabditis brenneri]